jgi:hypothetical protein
MKLADFQRGFLRRVFDTGPAGPYAIYRTNVLSKLSESLAATYPVVRRLVGDAFFEEAATRFARGHAPSSGDLNRYGGELADFLARYSHARSLPYLADVARLEWACGRAYHAADGAGFDFAALGRVPEDKRPHVRLALHPAAALIASEHPIAAIWKANQPDRDGTPERAKGPDFVLVHRQKLVVAVESLDASQWRFLEAVRRGETLSELAADPVIANRLPPELVRWTRCGVIDGFIAPR